MSVGCGCNCLRIVSSGGRVIRGVESWGSATIVIIYLALASSLG
jgi:hypothetical protein